MAAIKNSGFELLRHPPYLQDLAPSDFYLFPKLKEYLGRCKFADNDDVMSTENVWLEHKEQQVFYNGIHALYASAYQLQETYVER